jgi:DNA-binding transcriptional MerR regulator/effector-binding domain-containing protein
MYKVGEFARLAQVSIRLLHYYDEIGLFKPQMTGNGIGYRYYSVEQLSELYRILAMRDLGLSLEEIKFLLQENVSTGDMRGILLLKRAELHRHVVETQARLAQVESRLAYLEGEGKMQDILLKPLAPLPVISLRQAIEPKLWIGDLYRDAWVALCMNRLTAHVKGYVTIYHTSYPVPHLEDNKRVIEACFILDTPTLPEIVLEDGRQMRVYELAGVEKAACVVDKMPDRQRHQTHREIREWMKTCGYQLAMPVRELNLKRSGEEAITEIQYPLSS